MNRIYCGEGTECSPHCPAWVGKTDPTVCRIINKILEVQNAKISAINNGKGVE